MGYDEKQYGGPGDIARLLREACEGDETAFDLAKLVGADGKEQSVLKIERRKLQPEPPEPPVRAESGRRIHAFGDKYGFLAYIEKYGGSGTVILADPQARCIAAVMDNAATHGFEVVTFKPQPHPFCLELEKIVNQEISLRTQAAFINTHRRRVIEPNAKQLAQTLAQIRVSRKIEAVQGFGRASVNGVMVETKIGTDAKSELVELPETIVMEFPLFVGEPFVQVELDLVLTYEEDYGVLLTLQTAQLADKLFEAFTGFRDHILAETTGLGCVVAIGFPQFGSWDYLPNR